MTAGHELVQPVEQDVFGAQQPHPVYAAARHLVNLLVISRKARRRLDKQIVLGDHPMPPLLLESKLRQEIVNSRTVREVEIDVGRRVSAVRPKLNRKPADDDCAPVDLLDLLIDERDDGELPLGLVLERKRLR